jgi:aspartate/methionine/tyrosine aminotransferase
MTVATAGDDVLIPAPFWTSYPEMVRISGANPVIVETKASEDYVLTPEALRKALQAHPKTTCIIMCNPSNPTGCVASKDQLAALAKVLEDFPSVRNFSCSF